MASGRGGYNTPASTIEMAGRGGYNSPLNFGRGGYNAPSDAGRGGYNDLIDAAGRGGYNRGGNGNDDSGRGGYNWATSFEFQHSKRRSFTFRFHSIATEFCFHASMYQP